MYDSKYVNVSCFTMSYGFLLPISAFYTYLKIEYRTTINPLYAHADIQKIEIQDGKQKIRKGSGILTV